jgi:hypothetical protein
MSAFSPVKVLSGFRSNLIFWVSAPNAVRLIHFHFYRSSITPTLHAFKVECYQFSQKHVTSLEGSSLYVKY